MNVHTYEKAFLMLGGVLLVACLGALLYASMAMGLHLPGRAGAVDPATVFSTPPFDEPGLRQTGEGTFEAVVIGQAWVFRPDTLRIPLGAEVTFLATTPDVLHGFHVAGTRLNMMLIPGQISRATYRFETPGEFMVLCHEYCGLGHHNMHAKIIVE